jgi:anthranilate phosphoribosyltransferase
VHTWPDVLSALLRGESLSADATAWAMGEVMSGNASPVQVASFAVALRAKGETAEEVTGLATAMLEHAQRIRVDGPAVDTCGTGGDRARTVNISTMAALVVRGAGITVVKHGNRAASSACGSADVLEALGVVVDLPPGAVEQCVARAGIGFCFAPVFHPALRHAATARSEMGVPTVFNFLGPLTNPAQPPAQAVGVADARMAGVMAGVLANRGVSALLFRGEDGLDELSIDGPSQVWAVTKGSVREDRLDPAELGISRPPAGALAGGDATTNADVVRRLLAGEPGPVRDAVVVNAAAAIAALDGVTDKPVVGQLQSAVPRAVESIDSGEAGRALAEWVETSQQLRDGR